MNFQNLKKKWKIRKKMRKLGNVGTWWVTLWTTVNSCLSHQYWSLLLYLSQSTSLFILGKLFLIYSFMVTGYKLNDHGLICMGCKDFSLYHQFQTSYRGPSSLLCNRYQMSFHGWVKWPKHEADCSPPSSTDIKFCWASLRLPLHDFMSWFL